MISVWKVLATVFCGLLILPLFLTGCTGTETVSAQEIADNFLLAQPDTDTYKMDMNLTYSIDIYAGTDRMTMDGTGDATVTYDGPAREMQLQMDMIIEYLEEGTQNISEIMYMVDNEVYINISADGVDQWMKMGFDEDIWDLQDQLNQQADFLKDALEITRAGEEVIDGIDCYILKIKPDMASLFDWVQSQMEDSFSNLDISQLDLGQMFKNYSIKQWIAKDSWLPVRSDVQATMEFLPEYMGADDGEMDRMVMEMQGQAKYYDYNEPVNIELPEEALTAEPLL